MIVGREELPEAHARGPLHHRWPPGSRARLSPTAPSGRRAPRKLLHVFSTFCVGGAQARTAQLIHRLDPSTEHLLVAADGCLDGIHVLGLAHRVRVLAGNFVKGHGVAWRNLMLTRSFLRMEQPDVLLTYNFGAIEAALAHRLWPACRHLHFEDGFGFDEVSGRQLPRRVWLRRLALSGRSRIIVPSRALERIAQRQWRFAASRIEYLPNGVDVDRFAPSADPGRPPIGLRVGIVSALRPEKNIARLMRAVAALPETAVGSLVVAGDGPERRSLTALADRLQIAKRVTFAGHVARPEHLMRRLDLFALSSDTEQMPLTLLEAMATGLPVVATDVGDIRATLPPPQHPFVVQPDNGTALSAAMAVLAGDRALGERLGAANRAHVCAHYSASAMIRRYSELFDVPAAADVGYSGASG